MNSTISSIYATFRAVCKLMSPTLWSACGAALLYLSVRRGARTTSNFATPPLRGHRLVFPSLASAYYRLETVRDRLVTDNRSVCSAKNSVGSGWSTRGTKHDTKTPNHKGKSMVVCPRAEGTLLSILPSLRLLIVSNTGLALVYETNETINTRYANDNMKTYWALCTYES